MEAFCCIPTVWFPKDQFSVCSHVSSDLWKGWVLGMEGCGTPEGCSAIAPCCPRPAQEQHLSRPLPIVNVFYWSFSLPHPGAELAGVTVWERKAFPGASVGAVPGEAPAHERWRPWCPQLVTSVTTTVQALAECPQGFGGEVLNV